MRGKFHLTIKWSFDRRTGSAEKVDFIVSDKPISYSFNQKSNYSVRVALDGNLAYLGTFDEDSEFDLPI